MALCNYANYMLIFQLHLPHVIPNSMQALHSLSHSEIYDDNQGVTNCKTYDLAINKSLTQWPHK